MRIASHQNSSSLSDVTSLKAALLHHLKSATRVARKKIWNRRLFPAIWPIMARVLQIVALQSREVTPATCANRRAVVLTGATDSFISGRVAGQDLTQLSLSWLKETVGFKDVQRTASLEDVCRTEMPDITLVTYDWLLEHCHRPIRSVFELARQLRRLQSPAFVMLPDGFWLRITAMGSLIVALAGGSQIVLQDSVSSHTKFGTIRPTGPHFWTWPPHQLDEWKGAKPWSERKKLALLATGGGGPYRQRVVRQIEPKLRASGYQTRRTTNSLSWRAYVNLHRESRIVVTTCRMQPEYLVGPRYYQKLIPALVVTGRVWEAFASGSVLITDANPVLESLGFVPGQHYLALPDSSESDWNEWHLPSDETLAIIAYEGATRFRDCVVPRKYPDPD